MRDLVTTKRDSWLAAKSLRVVEDASGTLSVALDPIGCKPGDFVITMGGTAARLATDDRRIKDGKYLGNYTDTFNKQYLT